MSNGDPAAERIRLLPLITAICSGVAIIGVLGLVGLSEAIWLTGTGLLPALLLATVLGALSAAAVIELGGRLPEGSGYLWFRESLPQPFGFLGGWIVVALSLAGAAVCGLVAGAAVAPIVIATTGLPASVGGVPLGNILGVASILAVAGVVGAGIPWPSLRAGGGLVGGVLLGLFALLAFGRHLPPDPEGATLAELLPSSWAPAGIAAGAAILTWCLSGFLLASRLAEQVPPSRRTVPRVALATLLVGAFILVIDIAALVPHYPPRDPGFLLPAELDALARATVPGPGPALLLIGIAVAAVVALTTIMDLAGRTVHEMASDQVLPAGFADTGGPARMPQRAILFAALVAGAAVLAVPDLLIVAAAVLYLLRLVAMFIALIALRRKIGLAATPESGGSRSGAGPLVAVAGIVLCVALLAGIAAVAPVPVYLVVLWLLVGGYGYTFFVFRRVAEEEPPPAPEITVREGPTHPGTTVIVAASDPAQAALVTTAATVARVRGSRLVILTVVPVAAGRSLSSLRYDELAVHLKDLESLEQAARRAGVSAQGELTASSDIAKEFARAAQEFDADLFVLGWRGSSRRGTVLGTSIDSALRTVRCDVAVLQVERARPGTRDIVLVPGDSLHGSSALGFVLPLARALAVPIVVLVIATSPEELREARKTAEETARQLRGWGAMVTTKVVTHQVPSDAIAAESRQAGIVVVGSNDPTLLRRLGDIGIDRRPGAGLRASCPVVLVRSGRALKPPSVVRRKARGPAPVTAGAPGPARA